MIKIESRHILKAVIRALKQLLNGLEMIYHGKGDKV